MHDIECYLENWHKLRAEHSRPNGEEPSRVDSARELHRYDNVGVPLLYGKPIEQFVLALE